ncbi:GNAT family N-acetyltransferase [Klugiella xanthotipulae]|uniref:Ribosomal protein S18 acetylase RimI-like enzyme n=1 Tax=Klugiella xanthotipulae TaxID=244735 RepID=A0A543HZC1_9MICO|nr:GNAT family N-acetyltransferase [Klugiella xanthotipulae]TQM63658.1 ribosomal protein S18 acetylase RimI-like enzyme [Klugiella xanthotipulae]
MVVITPATSRDAEALSILAAITFPLACPAGTPEESIREHIERNFTSERFRGYLADPAYDILVARAGEGAGELLGYTTTIHGVPTDEDVVRAVGTGPVAEISKVYVHPDAHGRGVSAALMTETLDRIGARGAETAWLGVSEFNARAIRFYAKSGFARVGRKSFLLGSEMQHDFVLARPVVTAS